MTYCNAIYGLISDIGVGGYILTRCASCVTIPSIMLKRVVLLMPEDKIPKLKKKAIDFGMSLSAFLIKAGMNANSENLKTESRPS